MPFSLFQNVPKPEEYCALRRRCGMTPRTLDAARVSLPKSLFAVSLRDEKSNLVAMGRVVGDLGCHVQVVDIAVDPNFQGQKLSRLILDNVMQFIESEVHPCAFVNLFADVDFLYHKYGFSPSTSKGMFLDRK